jgi:hypothetical protein
MNLVLTREEGIGVKSRASEYSKDFDEDTIPFFKQSHPINLPQALRTFHNLLRASSQCI